MFVYLESWPYKTINESINSPFDGLKKGQHLSLTMGNNIPIVNKTIREIFSLPTSHPPSCILLPIVGA